MVLLLVLVLFYSCGLLLDAPRLEPAGDFRVIVQRPCGELLAERAPILVFGGHANHALNAALEQQVVGFTSEPAIRSVRYIRDVRYVGTTFLWTIYPSPQNEVLSDCECDPMMLLMSLLCRCAAI